MLGLGLPVGCEFLDPITPQYISDTVAWGAIGARTTESQIHRQLGSGLSMPVGLQEPHRRQRAGGRGRRAGGGGRRHAFAGVDINGTPAILHTRGNPDCHVILRGGSGQPNYAAAAVAGALEKLRAAGLPERVVIDASHDNSGKDPERQPAVAADVGEQVAAGSKAIVGMMLESFLVGGRQELEAGAQLTYGQSITDACMDWDTTVEVLDGLAAGACGRARRRRVKIAVLGVGPHRGVDRPGRARARAKAPRWWASGARPSVWRGPWRWARWTGRRAARGGARRRGGLLLLRARRRPARPGRGGPGRRAAGLRGHATWAR